MMTGPHDEYDELCAQEELSDWGEGAIRDLFSGE